MIDRVTPDELEAEASRRTACARVAPPGDRDRDYIGSTVVWSADG